ncbi:DUF350 domain-containing protein [Chloroflexota bacterium]
MNDIGLITPFYVTMLLWLAKTVILSFICGFLAWLGIRAMDAITPDIPARQRIGESPFATGLYIGGFFVFIGLVVHGAATAPGVIGGPVVQYLFDFRLLGLIAASFVVSLLIVLIMFLVLDKMTPKIPFKDVEKDPKAVGVFVFGYLVFFGLILHAAMTSPLL